LRPKITVITAVLNRADKLEETIQSVLAFNHPGIDYIIIDGGSTDGTLEIIESHSGRLKYWVSEPDRSVYDAMNKGWQKADPESWILFLGAGDRLLSLPGELPAPGCREVLFGNVSLDDNRVFYACADFKLKLFNTLHHQALLVPKWLHPQPPFNLGYAHYADFDFNQKLYKKKVAFRFSPQLQSYAAPGGLTENLVLDELTRIVCANFGFCWAALAMFGFKVSRCLPLMKKLRPIRKAIASGKRF